MNHRLLPVGARPLHPAETLIVAAVTARGVWVRQCACGWLLFANDQADMTATHLEHVAAAQVTS